MRDRDIRNVLLSRLKLQYKNDSDTTIVQELGLCQGIARIDLAVVNGSIHGYEIKSEKDNLSRLATQQKIYNKVFDCITIVASPRHLNNINKLVPDWWGLSKAESLNGNLKISPIRAINMNPSIDPSALVQLLWRDEALDILKKFNMHKGVKNKPRRVLWERLTNNLSLSMLHAEIREAIKQRKNWKPA